MHDFHLALPDEVYQGLRDAATRANQPAATLARQAIESWLRDQDKLAQYHAIADYAEAHGGSLLDLDPELEAASLEHLLATDEGRF